MRSLLFILFFSTNALAFCEFAFIDLKTLKAEIAFDRPGAVYEHGKWQDREAWVFYSKPGFRNLQEIEYRMHRYFERQGVAVLKLIGFKYLTEGRSALLYEKTTELRRIQLGGQAHRLPKDLFEFLEPGAFEIARREIKTILTKLRELDRGSLFYDFLLQRDGRVYLTALNRFANSSEGVMADRQADSILNSIERRPYPSYYKTDYFQTE